MEDDRSPIGEEGARKAPREYEAGATRSAKKPSRRPSKGKERPLALAQVQRLLSSVIDCDDSAFASRLESALADGGGTCYLRDGSEICGVVVSPSVYEDWVRCLPSTIR